MIFASNIFLLYFLPVFLLLYWLAPKRVRNYIALAGSLLFYAWGAPVFVFVLIGSSLADFLLSHQISSPGKPRWPLWLGIAYNIGLLLYFKYANFFMDNWNAALGSLGFEAVEWTAVIIPLGISFFTFQKISYLIDVSRKVKTPPSNFLDYLLYVSFFPQLVAGPIVRYHEIADQIQDRAAQDTLQLRWSGMLRFCIGLARKVLIANPLSVYVHDILSIPGEQLSMEMAWMAPLIFAFVVYHDFAGYSDMAIGLGRMMGFQLPENFNNPYTAASITEFWRRWHISLTAWFRTYLFWPMRRIARGKAGLAFNLLFVFTLVGFWHGAAWTFILFGLWHGIWLLVEHYFLGKYLKRIPKILSVPWTFLIVLVGIVPFVTPGMEQVMEVYQAMFGMGNAIPEGAFIRPEIHFDFKFWFLMATGALFSFFYLLPGIASFQKRVDQAAFKGISIYAWSLLAVLLLVLSIGELARMGFQPFIYFMF